MDRQVAKNAGFQSGAGACAPCKERMSLAGGCSLAVPQAVVVWSSPFVARFQRPCHGKAVKAAVRSPAEIHHLLQGSLTKLGKKWE